jgi:hypothetical protein
MGVVPRRIFGAAESTELSELFVFEHDFVVTLRCIPMAVRFKLDLAGVKLSLRQWSRFTIADRTGILTEPYVTPAGIAVLRARLIELVAVRTGGAAEDIAVDPEPRWRETRETPTEVVAFAGLRGVAPPTPEQWRALTDLRRFTLLKLTRDGHDNVNFVPALREFGLLS